MLFRSSVDGLVMVLLGGLQTLVGPIIGAVSFTWLQDFMARTTEYWRAIGLRYPADLMERFGSDLFAVASGATFRSPARYDEEVVVKTWVEAATPRMVAAAIPSTRMASPRSQDAHGERLQQRYGRRLPADGDGHRAVGVLWMDGPLPWGVGGVGGVPRALRPRGVHGGGPGWVRRRRRPSTSIDLSVRAWPRRPSARRAVACPQRRHADGDDGSRR